MKKKVLTILLTAALFFSAVALGISSVFRVDALSLSATVTTEEGKAQAERIQEDLQALYRRKSMFSLDRKAAEAYLRDYPYFRLLSFEKNYPDGLRVEIREENETYAVENGSGEYYILGDSGAIADIRSTAKNNRDGADLVLLRGLTVTGERGTRPTEQAFQTLLSFCGGMDETLGGIRANVLSVEIAETAEAETPYFLVAMREGVTLYVYEPEKLTLKKAEAAINAYLSMSDAQRAKGKIIVNGTVPDDPLYEE